MLKRLLYNERFVGILWVALALATVIQNVILRTKYNNYLIFEGVAAHVKRIKQAVCLAIKRNLYRL